MADTDLTVRFGGDTTALNANIAQARQAVAAFAPGATSQAKASLDGLNASFGAARTASTVASSSWRENLGILADLTIVLRGAHDALMEFAEVEIKSDAAALRGGGDVLKGLAGSYNLVGAAVDGTVAATDAGLVSLEKWFTSAAYAERGSRLFAEANSGIRASIGQTILGLDTFIDKIKLAYSSVPATELAGISAAGGLDRFIAQVDALGGAGSAKSALVDFTAELQKIPGLSQEAAGSIEVMLATIPNYTRASNDILIALIQSMSKTGDEAVANARKISDAFKDDNNGGKILGDLTGQLKNLNDIQVLAARISTTLKPDQAISYFDTVIAKIKQQAALQKTTVDENRAALEKIPLVGGLMVRTIQDQIDKQRQFSAAVEIATLDLERQKKAAQDVADAIKQADAYEKLIAEDSTRVGRLDQANKNKDLLNSGATQGRSNSDAGVGGDRDLLIRTLIGEAGGQGSEGLAAVASVIRNRVESAFDGMKTYRDVILEGNGKQFNTWAPGNAAGDRVKSMSTDDPQYRAVAALVDKMAAGKLDDPTNGATSFFNPKTATNPFPMTNTTDIGDHRFGNTKGSPKVRSDDEDEERTQRLQEQNDAIRKINDEKRGGTEADMAALAIAQQNAAGLHDEVAQAQALLDAKKKTLEETKDGSPEARRAAESAVAEAEISLQTKVAAVDKATNELRVAQTREGSKERLDATLAGLNAEIAAAQGNAAKIAELEKQKYEATKSYANQTKADAAELENARYDSSQRRFKEEQDNAKEEVKLKGLSYDQERAMLAEVLDRQTVAEKAHYTELQRIYADNPAQYRKYAQQLAEVDERTHQQRLTNERNYQQQILQTYKSVFDSIGSTVSSGIMGMIEGTTTFKQVAINVAKNILQQFIESRVRMVADWLAGEATKATATVTGQTAQTTAVATGEAARSGLVSAGAAAQAASTGASMIKSILGSAAETFAGIFGFLSPVLGPAAIGPAVAGQAAVAAVASSVPSFDVGAWRLPSDMVAQVHAGEMIVPAGPAAMMRAAAGGGAAAGQSAGGDTHAHFHVTAMDSRDVRRFFSDNSKHILGAIQDGVRTGSHLGFSKLRTS